MAVLVVLKINHPSTNLSSFCCSININWADKDLQMIKRFARNALVTNATNHYKDSDVRTSHGWMGNFPVDWREQ